MWNMTELVQDQLEEEINNEAELEQDELNHDIIKLNGLRRSRRTSQEPVWMQDYARGRKGKGKADGS